MNPRPVGALIARAHHATADRYRGILESEGVTMPQYLALDVLNRQSAPISQVALANHLGLEASTISPMLSLLAMSGLVWRARSVEDVRRYDVTITHAGQRALGRLRPAIAAADAELVKLQEFIDVFVAIGAR
jgi:DNA-binding MarR family transcriptional regulator